MFKVETPGEGPVLTSRYHMYKIGWGPQGDAAYQTSKLYAFQLQRRRILNIGFFVPMFQLNVTPHSRTSFDPWRGIILTNLVKVHKEMLCTKYKSSRPSSLRKKEFWILPSLLLCSNLWPRGRGGSFDPRGIIWTYFVEVYKEMLYTRYQSSSPYGLGQDF